MNERGSHTSIIEQSKSLIKEMGRLGATCSPGKIEVIKSAKTKTAKFKKINTELFELVVTAGSSKQTFKVFWSKETDLLPLLRSHKKLSDWNFGFIDTSGVHT